MSQTFFPLLKTLNSRGGSGVAVRGVCCVVAGVLGAIDIGFQGNGTLIPSGVLLSLAIGLGWSALLLFGPFLLTERLKARGQLGLWDFRYFFQSSSWSEVSKA